MPFIFISLAILLGFGTGLGASPEATQANKAAIEAQELAVHLLPEEWMRDPYVYRHIDGWLYLTATRLDQITWGEQGIELWRTKDLLAWESMGVPWSFARSSWLGTLKPTARSKSSSEFWLVAPEIYFMDDHWVVVHDTNRQRANLLVSFGGEYNDSFAEPFGDTFGEREDPSIFTDTDGSRWLVWDCAQIAQLKQDFSSFVGEAQAIGPSDRPLGTQGSSLRRIGTKYVLFGSAWSMDEPRQGSYNLYYCTADKLTGPYGPRRFAGRFCGHGTLFQDTQDRWWTTASGNGFYESDPVKGQQLCANKKPWTCIPQGLTLVPLEVRIATDGEVHILAKDPRYATPGPEEAQSFTHAHSPLP